MNCTKTASSVETWKHRISTALTFSVLGGLFWLGHAYHWQIPGMGHAHAEHAGHHEPASANVKAAIPTDRIVLDSKEAMDKSAIHVESPRRERIERLIHANGVVEFDQTRIAQLSVKAPGAISRVEKHIGMMVKKGDVLALVDSMEVGKAKAAFLSALAEKISREHFLSRLNSINEVVTQRQIREAEIAFRKAEIDLYNSRDALANLGLPIDISRVQNKNSNELQSELQFLGIPDDIAKRLDPKTSSANLIPIVAPFGGVVSGRDAVVGEIVSPADPVFTVVDLAQMWIMLDVRIEDADLVRVDQEVHFKPDGQKEEVIGRVNWMGADVDPKTRTLKVRVDVPNPLTDHGKGLVETRYLRAHTFGAGRILVDSDDRAIVISKKCVQWDDNQPTVFIKRGHTEFERRSVEIGIENANDVQITGGLELTDQIVDSGSRLLHSESYKRRQSTH